MSPFKLGVVKSKWFAVFAPIKVIVLSTLLKVTFWKPSPFGPLISPVIYSNPSSDENVKTPVSLL